MEALSELDAAADHLVTAVAIGGLDRCDAAGLLRFFETLERTRSRLAMTRIQEVDRSRRA